MTQKERLVELIAKYDKLQLEEGKDDLYYYEHAADYLLDNGVRRVVRCYECEYLGIKGLMDGYCRKDIMGLVSPNDYCSRGERRNDV